MHRWLPRAVLLVAATISTAPAGATEAYLLYVWKTGFDATVAGCDTAKLLAWDKAADPECYTHTWETAGARQWLWDTANRPGREARRLLLSDVKPRLEPAYLAGDCGDPDVDAIREMLADGHCKVPGVELFALLSTNDVAVSEQDHVPYVVWYNDVCAAGPAERFDGVAVNNEAWTDVRCTTTAAETDYLDDLQAVADAAALQVEGTLATHYSIGWKWSYCGASEVDVDWGGTLQPATHHMIEIFDTVDVQVAHTTPTTVASRLQTAGYAHAVGLGKPIYSLSYANERPITACVTTHFPYVCGSADATRTDEFLMQDVFDAFAANGVPQAIGGIHFFRGVYSTGVHPDWPSYASGTVETCLPSLEAGPLVFADPDDDDVIGWPPATGVTVYELARADGPTFDSGCRIVASTPETTAVDPERPEPGEMLAYLLRVAEPQSGDWGQTSHGEPRRGCLPP